MNIKDINYMKAWMIEWFRYGIKTFDERTNIFMTEQSRIDRKRFSALLEEFVDILDESREVK